MQCGLHRRTGRGPAGHGVFELERFSQTLAEAARCDGRVFVILNSPAHIPTGYSIPLNTWDAIVEILNGRKVRRIEVLQERARVFMGRIRQELIMPYHSGFFMSVVSDRPMEHNEALKREGFFPVPMALGLRLAVCSVEKTHLPRVADALNRLL